MSTDMSLYAEVQRNTRGSLMAWDIARGKAAWQVEQKVPANGGTLATAGGLVFQGATEGRLVAYADDDGRVLWETPIYSGVPGGPGQKPAPSLSEATAQAAQITEKISLLLK
jgi:outer membrane protein assembly factor BamB